MLGMPAACMNRCMPRNGALPARRRERQAARGGLRKFDKLLHGTHRQPRNHHHVVIFTPDDGDRLEITDRIVGQALQMRRYDNRVGDFQQHVAVGRGLMNRRGGDDAIRARTISTTTDVFQITRNWSATIRASRSVVPPGANPTTMRTVRFGKSIAAVTGPSDRQRDQERKSGRTHESIIAFFVHRDLLMELLIEALL